jgi:hypothetical protein
MSKSDNNDHRVGRREVLLGAAGVGGLGLLATLATPATAWASPNTNGPNGSYLINGKSAVMVPTHTFQAISTFAPGGSYVHIDTDTPNGTSLGQWASPEQGDFVVTFHNFVFDPSGNLVGTVTVHVDGGFESDTVHGLYRATGQTTTGGQLFPPDNGTFHGTRIRAEG